jgi:hypothetical protein
VTTLSPDDDISSLIREYNSMDAYQRSDFLDTIGTTRKGWQSMVAAHERRRNAARESRSSTDGSQAGQDGNGSSEGEEVVVAVRLPRATKRVELLLDAGEDGGDERSLRHRSAPPARGPAATGPGRRRADDSRRPDLRGRPGVRSISIVIVLPEK